MEALDTLDEDAVLAVFQPLEGDELAYQRYDVYKAGRTLKKIQDRMAASDTGILQANVRAQMKELLRGRIGHMMRHKLRFYKEALLFFYKGDLDAFNARKGGIDDLWAHLSNYQAAFAKMRVVHEGDDMGEGSGMTLYGFMHEYQKLYCEERAKAKALLEEIQEKRAEMPRGETMVFKQLADPVATFDLDKDFKEAEKAAHRRIHHIVGLEKKLADKTGSLTVTDLEQKTEEAKKASHAYAQAYEAMVAAYDYYLNGPRATLSLTDS